MDRIEAAYTLIVAEADERIKKHKGGGYCGKIVEVTQEVDTKLLLLMKQTREGERKNAHPQKM